MDEKGSSSVLDNAELFPVISVQASPAHVNLSLSSPITAAAKISIQFTLHGSQPVTIFVYNTRLSPPPGDHLFIHTTFDFIDAVSGTRYKPPAILCGLIIEDYRDYLLSYTNANNFLTLYPNTPHIIEHTLWPQADDGDTHGDPHNMEAGRSYRMCLADSAKKQHLWWRWGRKWQILRWWWWPFGDVKDVDDFVSGYKEKDKLTEVQFVWQGDCVVHVTD